jgi:hypothetical protein
MQEISIKTKARHEDESHSSACFDDVALALPFVPAKAGTQFFA